MFLFHREIIFCSRYSSFSIFNCPMIYQICDVMMGWVLVYDTGCIFQCLIQNKFENIDFSWVSWVVLLIWHYSNIYSGLKCVLFICKLENYKKDSLLIIFGGVFWTPVVVHRYHFGSGCDTVFECLLKHSH